MKIRLCSDAHIEMGNFELPKLPDDSQTILILAGDIGVFHYTFSYLDFINEMTDRFKRVVYIPGNHEFYSGVFPDSVEVVRETLIDIPNLEFGLNFDVVIDEVAFVCTTLWSDFEFADPISMRNCRTLMNDYKKIVAGVSISNRPRKLNPEDTWNFCVETIDGFIVPSIKKHKDLGRKVVVVTHHAPSFKSIPNNHRYADVMGSYASNIELEINDLKPDLWCHGHIHSNSDYMIGDTRVICNPAGYPDERNPGFNPELVIEI